MKQAREKKGWSIDEAATQMELASITNRESYYDLEDHDGELTCCYSLNEISRICNLLEVPPKNLLCDKSFPQLKIEELVEKIKEFCDKNKISITQFEDMVGWRVETCLQNPRAALDEWNLDCLKAVSQKLGIDWQSVVCGL